MCSKARAQGMGVRRWRIAAPRPHSWLRGPKNPPASDEVNVKRPACGPRVLTTVVPDAMSCVSASLPFPRHSPATADGPSLDSWSWHKTHLDMHGDTELRVGLPRLALFVP